MIRRITVLCFLAFTGLMTLSCQDATNPLTPLEPQMAKPVKPPKVAEPVIQEFWVYEDPIFCPGGQAIHFVASGTVTGMGVNVVYDHFFNGYQDLHDHYEWYFPGGPPRADTDFREDPDLGTIAHEDVCFKGERDSTPFKYFMDHPSTSISIGGVDGYDPIALLPAVSVGDDGFRFFRPKGVVLGGDTKAADGVSGVMSIWDHNLDGELESYSDVRSFAIWKGDEAPGNIFVKKLSVPSVTCTFQYGKGKNKNTVLGTTITMEVDFEYGAAGKNPETILPDPLDYWGQGRIRILREGAFELSPDKLSTPYHDGIRSYSWTFDTELSGPLEVEFVLDYLFASGSEEGYDWVYDPGQNGPRTSAGYDGEDWDPVWNVSKELYDENFPVAHSARTPVPICH